MVGRRTTNWLASLAPADSAIHFCLFTFPYPCLIHLPTGRSEHGYNLSMFRALAFATVAALIGWTQTPGSSGPQMHRLEATPTTVAYGYYWAEAKPVLRMASGDILDVDTL